MDNSTVMYISVFAAIVAVIALIMIWQVRSSLNQSAAPAPAPKKAAAPAARAAAPAARAAAPAAANNGAVVAAIAAAIVAMGGGEIVSIRPAARPGWTSAARIAGVSGNQQF